MSLCAPDRQNKNKLLAFIFGFYLLFTCNISNAQGERPLRDHLRIAAAASLRDPLEKMARQFEQENNIAIRVSYGASGALVTQLIHGAPFDLFLSADENDPKRLMNEGLAETAFLFATGRLALWVPEDSRLDLKKDQMQTILNPSVRKIAIANPLHAPYGRAAVSMLKHFGVYEQVLPNLVYGEDISQTIQFVESGGADIGIVAYSVVIQRAHGHHILVPLDSHPPLKQVGVIMKKSRHRAIAKKMMKWMVAESGIAILKEYGYKTESIEIERKIILE